MDKTFSNWRSVRLWESRLTGELRQQRTLWLHGLCIGLLTLAVTWGVSALQMRLGVDSLALRYLLSLGAGYLTYLLTIRLWAATLIRPSKADTGDWSGLDLFCPSSSSQPGFHPLPSGGGGDFAGGGASGDFSDGASGIADGIAGLAGNAIEVAAGSDEAAVVVVPVVAVFVMGCALFLGAGSLVLLYFGWEVLLAVAVELAFSYATARTAVRLTWKPLAGAVVCAVVLGATIDFFIPAAHSLPQAVKVLRLQTHGATWI